MCKFICNNREKSLPLHDFFETKYHIDLFMKPNSFIHRISKDLLQWMPLAQFEGDVIIVDKIEQLPEAISYLSCHSVVGVDTEARPSFTRGVHYPTALVQIATEERCYLNSSCTFRRYRSYHLPAGWQPCS